MKNFKVWQIITALLMFNAFNLCWADGKSLADGKNWAAEKTSKVPDWENPQIISRNNNRDTHLCVLLRMKTER